MLELFSTFQLASPALLGAAALAPLLIYAYLRKNPQKQRRVSSILILKYLPKRAPKRRRFRPPLRFFLELLALLLLCLAASAPSLKEPEERIAVLVDNSLSMQANDGASGLTDSRLKQAVIAANLRLSEFASGSRMTAFTSSPKLQQFGQGDESASAIEGTLAKIQPTYSGDALETAVSELASSNEYDRVIVVSDKAIEYTADLKGEAIERAVSPNLSAGRATLGRTTRIEGIQVGSRAANAYLSNLTVSRAAVSEEGSKIIATVSYSGPGTPRVALSFSEVRGSDVLELGQTSVVVQQDKSTEAAVLLPAATAENAIYRAQITEIGDRATAVKDAIEADNTLWFSAVNERKGVVLLIDSNDTENITLGLSDIRGLSVERIPPAEYSKLSDSDLEKYSLIIFRGAAPSRAPRRPTLLVLPPTTNPIFPARAETNEPRLSSWANDHPITAYLRVELLRFGKVVLFDAPLWATSVLNVERGSVLVAGESQGVRFAGVGFEILPFEGVRTPALSILTLNLLNWLTGETDLGTGLLSGGSTRLEAGTWRLVRPDGKSETIVSETASPATVMLGEPGVYRLLPNGAGSNSPGRVLVVNTLSPEESSTYLTGSFQSARTIEQTNVGEKGASPLWPIVITAALMFLVFEMLLRLRKVEGSAA